MKYLKLFEQHNIYYNLVNDDEFYDIISYHKNNVLSFSEEYKRLIEDRLIGGFECELSPRLYGNKPNYNVLEIKSKLSLPEISIWQLGDEWFAVLILIEYGEDGDKMENYHCDQWDGLVKCLKDKNIIS